MNHRYNLVLSIYPTSRGFAYVLFEGSEPYDWGVRDIRKKEKNECTLKGVQSLIDRYHPDYLIIEDSTERGSRRSSRIRRLYRQITHLAETYFIDVHRVTKGDISRCFSSVGALRKHEIAHAIALQVPAFSHRLPKVRKIWMSEDPKQSLFDAAALGIVFCRERRELH